MPPEQALKLRKESFVVGGIGIFQIILSNYHYFSIQLNGVVIIQKSRVVVLLSKGGKKVQELCSLCKLIKITRFIYPLLHYIFKARFKVLMQRRMNIVLLGYCAI